MSDVNGINGGSNPPSPPEDLPDVQTENIPPARISDVPYIGDGFHVGGSRAYANKPRIMEQRRQAWSALQDRSGLLQSAWTGLKKIGFVGRMGSFIRTLISKIKGDDDDTPNPPVAGNGPSRRNLPSTHSSSPAMGSEIVGYYEPPSVAKIYYVYTIYHGMSSWFVPAANGDHGFIAGLSTFIKPPPIQVCPVINFALR